MFAPAHMHLLCLHKSPVFCYIKYFPNDNTDRDSDRSISAIYCHEKELEAQCLSDGDWHLKSTCSLERQCQSGSLTWACLHLQSGASGQCVCICQPTSNSPNSNSGSQDSSSGLQQDNAPVQNSPPRGGLINTNIGGSTPGGSSGFGTLGKSARAWPAQSMPGWQQNAFASVATSCGAVTKSCMGLAGTDWVLPAEDAIIYGSIFEGHMSEVVHMWQCM